MITESREVKLQRLLADKKTIWQVMEEFDCSFNSVRNWIKKYGFTTPKGFMATGRKRVYKPTDRKRASRIDQIDAEKFKEAVRTSFSFSEVMDKLDTTCRTIVQRRCDREGIDYSHFGFLPKEYTPLMTEEMLEHLDGFMLGDGSISNFKNGNQMLRMTVEYKEFAEYGISFFECYGGKAVQYASATSGYETKEFKNYWTGITATHPDLSGQRDRWYAENHDKNSYFKFVKKVPADVRITPKSVMLWYLGDGSLGCDDVKLTVQLSTDGFKREDVARLCAGLSEAIGAECTHSASNRILLGKDATVKFFDFIGWKSPIRCYDYKFDVPEWRRTSKRLYEVAEELNIPYDSLTDMVRAGRIPSFRPGENHIARMMPEHVEYLKQYLAKRARTMSVQIREALEQKGPLTTAEIAVELNLTTKKVGDCIINRMLEEKGVVNKAGTKHCSVNDKTSVAWVATKKYKEVA